MENYRWNDDNLKGNWRNVFIFRDTDHEDKKIQRILTKEIWGLYKKNVFQTLFIEGQNGLFSIKGVNFLGDLFYQGGTLENIVAKNNFFINKIKRNKIELIGIDNYELIDQHEKNLKSAIYLYKKILRKKQLSSQEKESLIGLKKKNLFFSDQRTKMAVKEIDKQMRDFDLQSAGVLFGEGHYSKMIEELEKRKIGYASFYPPLTPHLTLEREIKYIQRL